MNVRLTRLLYVCLLTLTITAIDGVADEPNGVATSHTATTAPTTQGVKRLGVVTETRMSVKMGGREMPPQQLTAWFEGGRTRTDSGTMMSSITQANGDSIILMHQQRTYTVMNAAALKEGMERMGAIGGGAAQTGKADVPPVANFTPTGRRQQIGDYAAEAYTVEAALGGQKIVTTFWFAADYPDADALTSTMLPSSMPGLPFKLGTPPKGVVLRTEMGLPGGGLAVTDTVSIKRVEIDEAIFQVPATYKQAVNPVMPMPN